jgi:hypothetical protein
MINVRASLVVMIIDIIVVVIAMLLTFLRFIDFHFCSGSRWTVKR